MRALTFLAVLSFSTSTFTGQDAEEKLTAAELLEVSAGDLQKAMAAYQALIADEKIPAPTRARALLRVGRCQRKLGRLEAAKKTLEELLKGYPEEAEALRLARSFLKAIETGRVENLMLPKLDGLSVLRWFRKRSQSLPVLILSTTGREEEKVDNHILHLRRKLEPDPENPRHILMRHGMGYELRD